MGWERMELDSCPGRGAVGRRKGLDFSQEGVEHSIRFERVVERKRIENRARGNMEVQVTREKIIHTVVNRKANSNGKANPGRGGTNRRGSGKDQLSVIVGVEANNASARRTRRRRGEASSKEVTHTARKTSKVSGNHLIRIGTKRGSAGQGERGRDTQDLVAGRDRITREERVKKRGEDGVDPSQDILHNPVTPRGRGLNAASAGFATGPANRMSKHDPEGSDVGREKRVRAEEVGEERNGRRGKEKEQRELEIGAISDRTGTVKVSRRVRGRETEAAAAITPVGPGVRKDHVVGDGSDVERSIRRDPGGEEGNVIDQIVSVGGTKLHFSAAVMNIVSVDSVEVRRVKNNGVDLGRGEARGDGVRVVMLSDSDSKNAISRDAHRPRAVIAIASAGGEVNKRGKISNVSRAKRRRQTEEGLGSDKLLALNDIALIHPSIRNDVG